MKTFKKNIIIPMLLAISGIFTANAQAIKLSISNVSVMQGDTFQVVLKSDSSFTGRNVMAYQIGLTYSSSTLEFLGLDSVSSLLSAWGNPALNSNTAGQLRMAGAGTQALSGNGNLMYFRFRAKNSGSSTVGNIASYTMFNDGSPAVTFGNGTVAVAAISMPSISPASHTMFVGEQVQMSASGGLTPYTYSVEKQTVASISASGLLSAVAPGTTKVRVTDARGNTALTSGVFDVRGVRLSVQNINAPLNDTVYLPINIEFAAGVTIFSGYFDITFNNSQIEGISQNVQQGDFPMMLQTNASTGKIRVSFASTNGLSTSGTLCRIAIKALQSGTHTVSLQNVLFNEDLLAFTTAGSISTSCVGVSFFAPTLPENAATNQNNAITFHWQAATNAVSYRLYLWKDGSTAPVSPTRTTSSTSASVSNLEYGATYHWKVTAVNQCSTLDCEERTFVVKNVPDLYISDIQVDTLLVSGDSFDIEITVKNAGPAAVNAQWRDAVYISADSSANGSKTQLGIKYNLSQLEPGGSYHQTFTATVPNEYSGYYYIFARADVNGNVVESDESNNYMRFSDPVKVSLRAFPDISVKNITAAQATLVPDDSLQINFTVENIGTADAVGGWNERITLVADNGQKITLTPQSSFSETLAAGASVSRSVSIKLPKILRFSGVAHIDTELLPKALLVEHSTAKANNIATSASTVPAQNRLFLTLNIGSISENSTSLVPFTLTRSGDCGNSLIVNMLAAPSGQINLDAQIVIPAGKSTVNGTFTAIDNQIVDGQRTVNIGFSATDYQSAEGSINILDNEDAVLTAVLSATQANEGDSLYLTITRNLITASPLTVYIATNKPNQWTFDNAATIAANEASIVVPIHVSNDNAPEIAGAAQITVSSAGFVSGVASAVIYDDDVPELQFTVSQDTISEADGVYALQASIKRLSGTGAITVRFNQSPQGLLILPSQLTMPANVSEIKFNIGVVDNAEMDGYRQVTVSGGVLISGCNCAASVGNGGYIEKTIVIADNDGPTIRLAVNPISLFEGKTNGKLIITRNTPPVDNLTVNISHNDTSEVAIQTSAVIPVGTQSVEVPITALVDGVDDGTQTVVITASAAGYTSGFGSLYVTDINKPDLVLRNVSTSTANALTSDSITIGGTLINEGFLNAPSNLVIGFYLSQDMYYNSGDDELGTLTTSSMLLQGDSMSFSKKVKLPTKTGDFYLLVQVNPQKTITELEYNNNTSIPLSIDIAPEYTATAEVEKTVCSQNEPIEITGRALRTDLSPVANANVDVYLFINGARKTIKAICDENGEYRIEYTPLSGESGHYGVGACFPNQNLTVVQDEFDVLGLKRTSTDYIIWLTKTGQVLHQSLSVRNTSNLPLHNVVFTAENLPEGCSLTVEPIALLNGNETVEINYAVVGTVITASNDYLKVPIKLTCDEGVETSYTAYYYCQNLQATLETYPPSIDTKIIKDNPKIFEFIVFNKGLGESGKIHIALPNVPYMTLVSNDTIGSLAAGEQATVSLRLAATDEVPLNVPLTGNLAINCENGRGYSVPYKMEAVSTNTGVFTVDVVDEYTYNTIEAPHLANAHVKLKHPYSGAIVADGFTGADGKFIATDIPEGYYTLTVEAEKHEGYRGDFNINAGENNYQTVFIAFKAITYTWEVVPTEIEDNYQIDLIMTYETNVPKPVIIMEMQKEFPQLVNDETYPFLVTITNKGLIMAKDLEVILPEDLNEYEFETTFDKIDLAAQQSVQVPVIMRRKQVNRSSKMAASTSDISFDCSFSIESFWYLKCGESLQWDIAMTEGKYINANCTLLYGNNNSDLIKSTGAGEGTSEGPGGFCFGCLAGKYTPPNYFDWLPLSTEKKSCDECVAALFGTLMGFLPGSYGTAVSALGCAKSMASGGSPSCVISLIPGWGNVYSTITTAYICGRSFSPPARNNIRSFSAVNESNIPPVMAPLVEDLQQIQYAIDANRIIIEEITGIEKIYERENFIDFMTVIDSVRLYQQAITNDHLAEIKQLLEGSDIMVDEIDNFAQRWNSTIEANAQGIYEPNSTFHNIINKNILDAQEEEISKIDHYTEDRGYTDLADMYEKAYSDLYDETQKLQNSVCAKVQIQISQRLVLTREAFEGTLTIDNGHESLPIENIKLSLEVTNMNGEICNDLFEIETKALSILTGIDGSGTLGAAQKGSATILFIPERGAAPEIATNYNFGGSLSYLDPFTGLVVTETLSPVTLEVHPSPNLYLHYFMQRDILGDDPLTEDKVEATVPAELALMIWNDGFGEAKNVKVESAQPEIIDNEKGLAINFALIGSNLQGQPRQLGLNNINFGTIAPKTAQIGQWWFAADLLGHFTHYETRLVHLDSRGNPDLSLVSGATLHELIRSINVYNMEDNIADFLVNEEQDVDEMPDIIYLSNGATIDVAPVQSIITQGTPVAPDYECSISVTPSLYGWNYGKFADPTDGRSALISIIRQSDGFRLPERNVWQTYVTLPDGADPVYENLIHFTDNFDEVQPQTYILKFSAPQINVPEIDRFEGVPTGLISTRLDSVVVVFKNEIDDATFTWEDLVLRCQEGANLINNTVIINKLDSVSYSINFSELTVADGYYVLTVNTDDVVNFNGVFGTTGKQCEWTQYAYTPAVEEFIGLPENNVGNAFNELQVLFTVPIDESFFTSEDLIWEKNGTGISVAPTITKIDDESKLFKISGLSAMMNADGNYSLTVDMPNIKSKQGVAGALQQSVEWRIDHLAPHITNIIPLKIDGYDEQHITAFDIVFSEKISSLTLANIELYRDLQPQPLSQMDIAAINDTVYRLTQFRMLTYYEATYSLKIKLAGISDLAGNQSSDTEEYQWTVNRSTPAAVTNMAISPDYGFSATDGITRTGNLTLSLTVNAANTHIRIYQKTLESSILLKDTAVASMGTLYLPLSISIAGSLTLSAECVDIYGNKAVTDLPIYLDDARLSATFDRAPTSVVRIHPDTILLNVSDKILDDTNLKQQLVFAHNHSVINNNTLNITNISEKQYAIVNFGNTGVSAGGTMSLTFQTDVLQKYSSGQFGLLPATVEWTLRGNHAPTANAGSDQTAIANVIVILDGSQSFDLDGDALTYQWEAPSGITLNNANSVRPTFVCPSPANNSELEFTLVVSDGLETSQAKVMVTVSVATDIRQLTENSEMLIFPNPASTNFNIVISEPTACQLTICILDIRGQTIRIETRQHNGQPVSYNIDRLSLPAGIYFVKVITDNNVKTKKLIVK